MHEPEGFFASGYLVGIYIYILNQRWTLINREKDKRLRDHQMIHDMRCSIFKTPGTMSRIARAKRPGLLCRPL